MLSHCSEVVGFSEHSKKANHRFPTIWAWFLLFLYSRVALCGPFFEDMLWRSNLKILLLNIFLKVHLSVIHLQYLIEGMASDSLHLDPAEHICLFPEQCLVPMYFMDFFFKVGLIRDQERNTSDLILGELQGSSNSARLLPSAATWALM